MCDRKSGLFLLLFFFRGGGALLLVQFWSGDPVWPSRCLGDKSKEEEGECLFLFGRRCPEMLRCAVRLKGFKTLDFHTSPPS